MEFLSSEWFMWVAAVIVLGGIVGLIVDTFQNWWEELRDHEQALVLYYLKKIILGPLYLIVGLLLSPIIVLFGAISEDLEEKNYLGIITLLIVVGFIIFALYMGWKWNHKAP